MIYLKSMERSALGEWIEDDATETNEAYRAQLAKLQPRLSKAAWEYFWLGFFDKSIHDARLIGLTVGNGPPRFEWGKEKSGQNHCGIREPEC